MMTTGGHKAKAGTYWNMMTGERVDMEQEGVLPGGKDDRYVKAPAALAVAAGPLLGLVFAVFLPFIGIAMSISLAVRKLGEGLANAAAGSTSFGWRPIEAYLAGRKKKKAAREKTKGKDPGK
jgi:hypothetical protein